MPTIYISDRGDDKNDGLSLQTPVYSLNGPRNYRAARTTIAGTLGLALGSGSKRSLPTSTKKSDLAAHRPRGLPYINATIPK
jgi:hypothetical protein